MIQISRINHLHRDEPNDPELLEEVIANINKLGRNFGDDITGSSFGDEIAEELTIQIIHTSIQLGFSTMELGGEIEDSWQVYYYKTGRKNDRLPPKVI